MEAYVTSLYRKGRYQRTTEKYKSYRPRRYLLFEQHRTYSKEDTQYSHSYADPEEYHDTLSEFFLSLS